MVLSNLFDDDGLKVPPPPSTETCSLAVPTGAETRVRHRMHEAIATIPESARATSTAVTRVATAVPETARVTPVAVAKATSQRGAEKPDSFGAGQGGSGWARRFRTMWRESKL